MIYYRGGAREIELAFILRVSSKLLKLTLTLSLEKFPMVCSGFKLASGPGSDGVAEASIQVGWSRDHCLPDVHHASDC